jgi:hypothetical protein
MQGMMLRGPKRLANTGTKAVVGYNCRISAHNTSCSLIFALDMAIFS